MVWFKIGISIFFSSFAIWVSNYDLQLHAELNHVFGLQPKKNPSRLLDVILIFIILFGCALMAYSMPTDQIGLTVGSIIGMIIMAIACVLRTDIHN